MTVLAWDGKNMCSDSLATADGKRWGRSKKLHRLKSGAILGTAGDCDSRAVNELLDLCETEADLPSSADLRKTRTIFGGLLWLPDRTLWVIDIDQDEYDADVWYAQINQCLEKYAVHGSGYLEAETVLRLGMSAEEAVKAAIKSDIHCGGPVQKMTLEVPKPKKKKKVDKPKPKFEEGRERWRIPADVSDEDVTEAMKKLGAEQVTEVEPKVID